MRDADRALGAFATSPAIGDAAIAALIFAEAAELHHLALEQDHGAVAELLALRGDAELIRERLAATVTAGGEPKSEERDH